MGANASVAVKLVMVSRLFAVLDKLRSDSDDFAESIYRLLVYFLIEWNSNKTIREHLLSNFLELFKDDREGALQKYLVEPLCKIIMLNI